MVLTCHLNKKYQRIISPPTFLMFSKQLGVYQWQTWFSVNTHFAPELFKGSCEKQKKQDAQIFSSITWALWVTMLCFLLLNKQCFYLCCLSSNLEKAQQALRWHHFTQCHFLRTLMREKKSQLVLKEAAWFKDLLFFSVAWLKVTVSRKPMMAVKPTMSAIKALPPEPLLPAVVVFKHFCCCLPVLLQFGLWRATKGLCGPPVTTSLRPGDVLCLLHARAL